MDRRISLADAGAGVIFVAAGLAFGTASLGYQLGTAFRMGPGYFPLVLAGTLVLLGAAVLVKAFMATDETAGGIGTLVPLRGFVLVLGALVLFGVGVRGLGFAPAVFLTVFLAALASRRTSPVRAAVLAAGITAFCILVFIVGLGVPLPLVGRWLAF